MIYSRGPLLLARKEESGLEERREVISRKTGSTSSRQRGSSPPQVCLASFLAPASFLPSFLPRRSRRHCRHPHTTNSLNSITFSAAANCCLPPPPPSPFSPCLSDFFPLSLSFSLSLFFSSFSLVRSTLSPSLENEEGTIYYTHVIFQR